jgi:hypothetical protein
MVDLPQIARVSISPVNGADNSSAESARALTPGLMETDL